VIKSHEPVHQATAPDGTQLIGDETITKWNLPVNKFNTPSIVHAIGLNSEMNPKLQLLTFAIAVMMVSTVLLCLAGSTQAQHITYPIRVACVGDSITEKSGYTAKLATMLGTNYSVGNFGVSGTTVTLESETPYMKESKFYAAESFQPKIVVIMLGTNDARYDYTKYQVNFEEEYGKIISSFKNLNNNPEIILVRCPPIFNNNLFLNETTFSESVIPHIDNVAGNFSLPTVDVYDAFGNHSEYTADGVHPTSEGADIIASQVYGYIMSMDPP
jgi:alpha-L-fucosidase 2